MKTTADDLSSYGGGLVSEFGRRERSLSFVRPLNWRSRSESVLQGIGLRHVGLDSARAGASLLLQRQLDLPLLAAETKLKGQLGCGTDPASYCRRSLQKGCQLKGRQSGMPSEEIWSSFFDFECILGKLGCDERCGDVVEFGCGYGPFTEAAAKRIAGTVYALDIEKEMIKATRSRLAKSGLLSAQVEQRDFLAHGCGRPDASVGFAMLFNILHIEKPVKLLREARRVLVPGGKVGIIHWNYDSATPRGPSMDIRPRPEQCRAWAEEAGLQFARFEPLECCRYHWGLVVKRA